MSRKRIKENALTAAEKQARYRQKIADGKKTAIEKQIAGQRAFFHKYLDQLPDDEFLEVMSTVLNGGEKPMDKNEICKLLNLSDYEWKKLDRAGVIDSCKVKNNDDLFTATEQLRLKELGITPDQLVRLCHCTDKSFTPKEVSDFTGIPINKLKEIFPSNFAA